MAELILEQEQKQEVKHAKKVHVAQYKKDLVKKIVELIRQYQIVGIVNMENLPAKQLQNLRAKLREKVVILMTKKRIISIAFDEAAKHKPGIEGMKKYLVGMPALIFTNDNPFRLYAMLQKNQSKAFAKANQIAPDDIMISAGPTPFAPGPIIGELATIGIKSGVDAGKVAIKQDAVVAKRGEPIKAKVAEILARLGIEPVKVGLDLMMVFEKDTIYGKDVLAIDETEFMNRLVGAHGSAFALAMFISYPAKDTINQLIGMAFSDAKALGLSQNIVSKDIIEYLLAKAEMHAMALEVK